MRTCLLRLLRWRRRNASLVMSCPILRGGDVEEVLTNRNYCLWMLAEHASMLHPGARCMSICPKKTMSLECAGDSMCRCRGHKMPRRTGSMYTPAILLPMVSFEGKPLHMYFGTHPPASDVLSMEMTSHSPGLTVTSRNARK